MDEIRKRIVTDEHMRPVAVQIDYDDWVKIERALEQSPKENGPTDLSRHIGRLRWPIDGLEYQRQVRGADCPTRGLNGTRFQGRGGLH
ncbi:MAG: hypothetical protein V1790_07150 [Planctomycetota bacterium]